MKILTPDGYVDAADCRVGQAVLAIDPATGDRLTNFVEDVEIVPRPTRLPWQGLRHGKHKERWKQDWERWTARRDGFAWVRVNGDNLFFAEQSVWANDNVTHAKLLKAGDAIYDAEDNLIVVRDVDLDADGPDEWVRFKVSGDHSYVGDDVTLHNASRFWVLGTANWDASTTTNWSATSGGLGGASVPTSSDDVSFDILSNGAGGSYTTTITATANCQNLTFALPAVSGVPTLAGSSALNIFGSLTNIATMLWTYSGTATYGATATGKTITNAGVTYACAFTFNGSGGGWTLQDALTTSASKTVTVSAGSLVTGAFTHSTGFFVSTSGTRTLTLDNSTINITGTSGTPWNVSASGTLTFSFTGGTLNLNGGTAGTSLTANWGTGLTYNTINITAAGLWHSNNTIASVKNFSYTSTTNKTDNLLFNNSAAMTIAASGSLTIAGNSVVNRAFLSANTLGSPATITVPNTATVTLTNVDFQDIASAGTFGTWTGTSLGDALGNSGITFDGSTTQTYAGGTSNWSTLAAWTSRVPLPQDDVVVNTTTTGTLTADMPRLGRNLNFTSFTRSFQLGSQTAVFYGNLTLGASMTFGGGQLFSAQGRGAQTITSNGIGTPSTFQIAAFGGTYTLQDNYTSTSLISLGPGTFDSQGFNVTAANISPQTTIKATSSSVWSFSNTSGTPWNANASTDTTNFFATIKFTGAITSATFAGAGKTYNNLWWSNTAATGTLIITGANTFADFKINRTTARAITFPAAVTTTIASWTDESLGTAVLTITSSSAGSAATLSKPGGDVRTDYCSIKDSAATGGASWRAGPHSTSVSGNSGWVFGNVDHAVSQTLTIGDAIAGSAAKNAKPSASLVCGAIEAGSITRYNLAGAATLAVGEQIAGSKTGSIAAAATLAAGARISGAVVKSQSGAGTLATAERIAGAVSAHDRVAASPLIAGAAISGSFGPGAITAAAELGVGAELGGAQVSSYSEDGALDVGAEIAGRGIFQAESMTVEVLPSGATVEVLPSSATVAQRQRARS